MPSNSTPTAAAAAAAAEAAVATENKFPVVSGCGRRRRHAGRGGIRRNPVIAYVILYLQVFFCFDRAMSSVVALGASIICNRIVGLAPRQRTVCQGHPDAMVAAGEGTKLAFSECRYQFRQHRWNCSIFLYSSDRSAAVAYDSALGHISSVGNRETAYTYAIRSAGVAYAVTQACSLGHLVGCGCDRSKSSDSDSLSINSVITADETIKGGSSSRSGPKTPSKSKRAKGPGSTTAVVNDFKWGGCSADVSYGLRFSRVLLDAREIDEDSRSLMNLHNNRAGRKALLDTIRTECKCHGVSGSCSMKTCWVTLPKFRAVGDRLTLRHKRARLVEPINGNRARRPVFLRLKRTGNTSPTSKRGLRQQQTSESRVGDRKPGLRDLVYLQPSVSYCDHAPWAGSLGTHGRICNKTAAAIGGSDGCDSMCCGRGYDTRQYTRTWQCECKFRWCCQVECRTCSERTEEYTCK